MKPISLQMYTVRDLSKTDPIGVLKQVAEIGYIGVEGGAGNMKPAEYRKVLDDLGLVCSSGGAPVPDKDSVARIVETAQTLGYDMVMCGRGPDDFKTMDAIKRTAEALQAGAALLKPHGVKLCMHNHWWEFLPVEGRYPFEIVLELATDLSSELDVYWACNFGAVDVPAVLKRNCKRVPLLHVKDGPLVQGQPHMAIGAGKMDIPAIVKAGDAETLKWLVVELDECATDMMTAVRESYAYLTSKGLGQGRR
jgi:sugar phosphate isomerase/epimerase